MKPFHHAPEESLLKLCRIAGIPTDRGWKTALAAWLGVKRVILSNWLRRGIPRHIIETVSRKGFNPDQWVVSISAPGSTISARPLAPYAEAPEIMTAQGPHLLEGEGLHSQTHHIQVGGQKIAVSTFSPDPGWIHRAVDEIMASDDQSVVLALESNVRVFLDKVTSEKKLERRIEKLEAELRREKNSTDCSAPRNAVGNSD